jgi:hypothetical protein
VQIAQVPNGPKFKPLPEPDLTPPPAAEPEPIVPISEELKFS